LQYGSRPPAFKASKAAHKAIIGALSSDAERA
jgi:hypothetical protein